MRIAMIADTGRGVACDADRCDDASHATELVKLIAQANA
jgi:hypothetical protein